MQCPRCGFQHPSQVNFCSNCGAIIGQGMPVPPPYPQAPPQPQRKPNYLAVGCIILLGLAMALSVSSYLSLQRDSITDSRTVPPSTTAQQAASTRLPGIRERVSSAGVELVVYEAKRSNVGGPYMKADKGYTYLLVDVIIKNANRDEQTPYNLLYFKMKDSDGFEYSASISTGKGVLTHGELSKGEEVRGVLAFEIPEKAKGLTLSYKPMVIFGGYETIRINLEQ